MAHDRAPPSPDSPPLPRWVLWLMLPSVLGPLFIFGFIVWSEMRHDPARCPFAERARKPLATDVVVVEEARNCVGSVEEHRYVLVRGTQRRLLGERRFDRNEFTGNRYAWQAAIGADGQVHVVVHNAGHEDMLFREGTAAEHEKDEKARAGH
jgi:hypothetical protein